MPDIEGFAPLRLEEFLYRIGIVVLVFDYPKHTMKMFLPSSIVITIPLSLCLGGIFSPTTGQEEVYGPPNLLKTTATPFSPSADSQSTEENNPGNRFSTNGTTAGHHLNLGHRLISNARVYLPGRMVLGRSEEFVVKGPPGSSAAIAMADKSSGSKSIYGHTLRLGSDRKLVSLGKIPESGVLALYVETPIQGDLIGQHLFFETVIWSKSDFSDMQIAVPVKSEISDTDKDVANGVIVSGESEHKRGVRIVPDAAVPLYQRRSSGLDSGRP